MLTIPGLIDIGTEVTGISWQELSRKAVQSGYTALIAAPAAGEIYTAKADPARSLAEAAAGSACDYARLAAITPENVRTIDEWAEEVPAALIDHNALKTVDSFARMKLISRLFSRWPAEKPICVRGNADLIGSAIFMGQVNEKKVHICSADTRQKIEMIKEAKEAGVKVSCDIHPLSLLVSSEIPFAETALSHPGTEDDRRSLWQHLGDIDCFSSSGTGRSNGDQLQMMLPLLLSMRKSQMLTEEDIISRCCVNPAKIFGIPVDPENLAEIDESQILGSPGRQKCVRRLVLHGQTVFPAGHPDDTIPLCSARIRGHSI